MTQRFEYGVSRIRDLQVRTAPTSKAQPGVAAVVLDGQPLVPTTRFWNSLHLRFGFTGNIFRYFRHDEVFQRISEVAPNDQIRWCVEWNGDQGKLLAVTSPGTGLVAHDDLVHLLDRNEAETTTYTNGIVRSVHTPRAGDTFAIAGDSFQNKFVLDTPIDGYGKPQVYLSLLRLVCSNGAIAYTPVFRSEVNVGRGGRDTEFAVQRVLDGFNNEEGYAAMRQRFEASTKSWASLNEVNRLYRTLTRAHPRGRETVIGGDGAAEGMTEKSWQRAFGRLTGDLTHTYGLVNLDALSVKRQRTLPAPCKVYDLLNFASEMATHHADAGGARTLQACLGDLIAGEYDLEGTADHFGDWRDFFIGHGETSETMTALHRR
ncbi:MAG: hypothetical protein K2R98_24650 [Gemmataceae bacterium]|nr:hypothetical protein [Gemmataceae bacterium]